MTSIGRTPVAPRVMLASAAALLMAACGSNGATSEPAARSGVGIVAEGCSLVGQVGSGAVLGTVGEEALVVTVAHTIKGATAVSVVDADGAEHDARVVAFDKDADLAVLAVDEVNAPALSVSSSPLTAIGAEGSMLTWSRDDGVEQVPVVVVKRLRVTIEDIYIDEVVKRTALEISGPVDVGDSGGPVLDAEGDVIGVIYASSRGRTQVGFATDRAELADLLASVTGSTVDNGTCS